MNPDEPFFNLYSQSFAVGIPDSSCGPVFDLSDTACLCIIPRRRLCELVRGMHMHTRENADADMWVQTS